MGSARLAANGRTKVISAQIASSCEASSTLHGVQPRLSLEAKNKIPLGDNSVADSLSLSLIARGAKNICREARDKAPSAKDLCRDVRDKAPLGANSEAILDSIEGRALCIRAKLASKGRVKTVASPCKTTLSGEAILASPIAKKKAFMAKPKAYQPKGANFQSP